MLSVTSLYCHQNKNCLNRIYNLVIHKKHRIKYRVAFLQLLKRKLLDPQAQGRVSEEALLSWPQLVSATFSFLWKDSPLTRGSFVGVGSKGGLHREVSKKVREQMSNVWTHLDREFPPLLLSSCTPIFPVAFLLQIPSLLAVLLKMPVRPTNDKLVLQQWIMTKGEYSGSMLTLKSIMSFWEWNKKR